MDRAECLATFAVFPPLLLSLSVPYLSIHLYPSTFSSSIEINTGNPVPEYLSQAAFSLYSCNSLIRHYWQMKKKFEMTVYFL